MTEKIEELNSEINESNIVQDAQLAKEISDEVPPSTQELDKVKQEYLEYVEKLKNERFECNTREEVIEAINSLCRVLELKTVIPRTERQTINGQRQLAIVGGTPIDLVKSQYPGLYPLFVDRLLELTSKL